MGSINDLDGSKRLGQLNSYTAKNILEAVANNQSARTVNTNGKGGAGCKSRHKVLRGSKLIGLQRTKELASQDVLVPE